MFCLGKSTEREPLVLASQPASQPTSQPANCSRPAPDSHVIPLTQFQHPCLLPELTLGALPFPYQARSWLLSSPLKPFVSCTSSLLLNLSPSSTPHIIQRGINSSTRRTSHQPLQSTPHFAHHVSPLYVLPSSSAHNGDDIVCFLSCMQRGHRTLSCHWDQTLGKLSRAPSAVLASNLPFILSNSTLNRLSPSLPAMVTFVDA